MDKRVRKERVVTDQATAMKMALWVANNKDQLEGKKIGDVRSIFYKNFHPAPSNGAIDAALEASGVTVSRINRKPKGAGLSNIRFISGCVKDINEKLRTEFGVSFLSEEKLSRLQSLIRGNQIEPPPQEQGE